MRARGRSDNDEPMPPYGDKARIIRIEKIKATEFAGRVRFYPHSRYVAQSRTFHLLVTIQFTKVVTFVWQRYSRHL